MAYRIVLKKTVPKELAKIPKKYRERIAEVIDSLADDPRIGKQLVGELSGYWSVRVWPYRILYSIESSVLVVYVIKVDHRKDVYR